MPICSITSDMSNDYLINNRVIHTSTTMSLAMMHVGHSAFLLVDNNTVINLDQVVAIVLQGMTIKFAMSSAIQFTVPFASEEDAKREFDAIFNDKYQATARVDTI